MAAKQQSQITKTLRFIENVNQEEGDFSSFYFTSITRSLHQIQSRITLSAIDKLNVLR